MSASSVLNSVIAGRPSDTHSSGLLYCLTVAVTLLMVSQSCWSHYYVVVWNNHVAIVNFKACQNNLNMIHSTSISVFINSKTWWIYRPKVMSLADRENRLPSLYDCWCLLEEVNRHDRGYCTESKYIGLRKYSNITIKLTQSKRKSLFTGEIIGSKFVNDVMSSRSDKIRWNVQVFSHGIDLKLR